MKGGHYGNGIGEIVATRLQCNGNENDIGQCSATWWPQTTSESHSNDVGVNCDGGTRREILFAFFSLRGWGYVNFGLGDRDERGM